VSLGSSIVRNAVSCALLKLVLNTGTQSARGTGCVETIAANYQRCCRIVLICEIGGLSLHAVVLARADVFRRQLLEIAVTQAKSLE
jgi:hypothetical protein